MLHRYELETHAPTCKALEQAATYFLFTEDRENGASTPNEETVPS